LISYKVNDFLKVLLTNVMTIKYSEYEYFNLKNGSQ